MSRIDPKDPGSSKPEGIEVLLLDLGGVIIDIDPARTSEALVRLAQTGRGSLLEDHSKAEQDRLFDRFERGELNASDFRTELREKAGMTATDQEIDQAWNAMLLDIPPDRFELLEHARTRLSLHLFSNTNEIHVEGFNRIVETRYGLREFQGLFDGIHLSYEMGARKPEQNAFRMVVERIGASPERILFIDDTLEHIEAARNMGLWAYHLKDKRLEDLEALLLP